MYGNKYRALFLGHVAGPEGTPWSVSPEQKEASMAGSSVRMLWRLVSALDPGPRVQRGGCLGPSPPNSYSLLCRIIVTSYWPLSLCQALLYELSTQHLS